MLDGIGLDADPAVIVSLGATVVVGTLAEGVKLETLTAVLVGIALTLVESTELGAAACTARPAKENRQTTPVRMVP